MLRVQILLEKYKSNKISSEEFNELKQFVMDSDQEDVIKEDILISLYSNSNNIVLSAEEEQKMLNNILGIFK